MILKMALKMTLQVMTSRLMLVRCRCCSSLELMLVQLVSVRCEDDIKFKGISMILKMALKMTLQVMTSRLMLVRCRCCSSLELMLVQLVSVRCEDDIKFKGISMILKMALKMTLQVMTSRLMLVRCRCCSSLELMLVQLVSVRCKDDIKFKVR
ncbi:uncharacterized protein LOC115921358 [Strongylocentrotus purpuratus]|uniref:Uncharacterized protein n=1 Tax=Strongylocentrotus purpuratus TaxID=7668 RepID=A0A7M7NCN6_STRPU|nr:uncharacterized protein LOC115921358 [Strongylocentrotus purpuratus]